MRKLLLFGLLTVFIGSGLVSCKSQKHCTAYDDTMEGYKPPKKKKKRQEGLFPKKFRL